MFVYLTSNINYLYLFKPSLRSFIKTFPLAWSPADFFICFFIKTNKKNQQQPLPLHGAGRQAKGGGGQRQGLNVL